MAEGIKIVEKDGVFHLSGVLNEYADFSPLAAQAEPLRLNMKDVSRLNSIGIRNLLRFLADWGTKRFVYEECPSEFVDQVNMIPALLGAKGNGSIETLSVPYECPSCDHEDEFLAKTADYADGRPGPERTCSKCGAKMSVLSDTFFAFLSR